MRIAIVAPPWFQVPPDAYGGIEWMCAWLAEGLKGRDHDVTLVGSGPPRTSARFAWSFADPPSERLGEATPEVIHAATVAETLRDGGYDVVHDNSLAGPLLAFERAIPTVVTAHGPLEGEYRRYMTLLSSGVSFVAISEAQRRTAPHIPWTATVYNALPVADYAFCADKDDYALFLARMTPDKGAQIAVRAARKAGIRLVLAGKCTEPAERRYFEEMVRPELGPGIEWIGQADTELKKRLLCGARCLLFPIDWEEPFGIAMVEAMAAGTPVVALPRGSVPEVVEDGVSGIVCSDPSELPAALDKAAELDPHACRAYAARRFDIDVMVSGYERVFHELVEGG